MPVAVRKLLTMEKGFGMMLWMSIKHSSSWMVYFILISSLIFGSEIDMKRDLGYHFMTRKAQSDLW